MNKKDVLARIDFLLKNADYVERDLKDVSIEQFSESSLLARAVSFSIFQIGEQVVKLQEVLEKDYGGVPWAKVRGMRNVIAHVYHLVDFKQVYMTAIEDVPYVKTLFKQIKEDLINHTC